MRWTLAVLTVLALCSAGFAQNLLTNPSFQDPACARGKIDDVPQEGWDGGLVTIAEGWPEQRIYEFDDNDVFPQDPENPGDVQVLLGPEATKQEAAEALAAAITDDPDGPANATAQQDGETGDYFVNLVWDGEGGDLAVNTTTCTGFSHGDDIYDFNECSPRAWRENREPVIGWWRSADSLHALRNGDVFVPECLDGEHASLQGDGPGADLKIFQVVSDLDPTKTYLLTGIWHIGVAHLGVFKAQLHDGTDPDSPDPTEVTVTLDGGAYSWLPFAIAASPSGTDMTVVLRTDNQDSGNIGMHLNDLSLVETTCTPPMVTDFAPEALFTGAVYENSITVSGSGFVADQTTVRLEGDFGAPDIVATDVDVQAGGEVLYCTLAIPAEADGGQRSVVVEVTDCGGNALGEAVYIYSSKPFLNGSFEYHNPGYNACPVQPTWAPQDWYAVEINGYGYQGSLYRDVHPDGAAFLPTCPPPDEWHYAASMSNHDGEPGGAENFIYQTFVVDPSTEYSFSGYFAGGGNNTVVMEMRDGPTAGNLLASADVHFGGGGGYDWTFNAISATTPPDAEVMTVGWRIQVIGESPHESYADHIRVLPCTSPITVTGITPPSALNNGVVNITNLAGTGFNPAGTPEVLLTKPGYFINATNVDAVSATQITCDFDLTGALSGLYDVVVFQEGCIGRLSEADPPAPLFLVIAENFLNGSFEDPPETEPETGWCPGERFGAPSSWSYSPVGNFTGGMLYRDFDENTNLLPACPPPDGVHYANSASGTPGTGEEYNRIFQTIAVTPGVRYSFSGWLAGRGHNNVYLEILDGHQDNEALASSQIHDGTITAGSYDWTFATVSGIPTNNYMTVMYRIQLTDTGTHIVRADDMSLTDQCSSPITVTDVTPDSGLNSGTVSITNLEGTGFDDSGGPPTVMLSKSGSTVTAMPDPVVVSPTQITCVFDLSGLPSGKYDIIVLQGDCSGVLVGEFLVIATAFVNGSFEEPAPPEGWECGEDTWGRPTGWNRNDRLHRDGSTHDPCMHGVPAGDHYGSMSLGELGPAQQAWQTLSVLEGSCYKFSGQFAGGGTNTVKIKMLNGDEAGDLISETTVSSGGGAYPWTMPPAVVYGPRVPGEVMTVMWEMDAVSGDCASHADALAFETVAICSRPFADADNDNDIDQDDFGVFQSCYTGAGNPIGDEPEPLYCLCMDRTGEGLINEEDFNAFEKCATGPGITVDPDDKTTWPGYGTAEACEGAGYPP